MTDGAWVRSSSHARYWTGVSDMTDPRLDRRCGSEPWDDRADDAVQRRLDELERRLTLLEDLYVRNLMPPRKD